MENPEKVATFGTKLRQTKNKKRNRYVLDTTMCKQTQI